jgi:hypothetical protein
MDDEPTVRTYLQTRGVLDECLLLNLSEVKKYAKREDIPGMTEVTTETLTVRKIKEAPEKVENEETDAEFRERIRNIKREEI